MLGAEHSSASLVIWIDDGVTECRICTAQMQSYRRRTNEGAKVDSLGFSNSPKASNSTGLWRYSFSATMTSSNPQNRGLVLSSFSEPLKLLDVIMPTASTGTVIVAVLATFIAPAVEKIYNGKMGFNPPLPMTPGCECIGRIHEIGPDVTKLKVDDVVYVDPFLFARDDADVAMLLGHFEGIHPESRGLMDRVWRHGALQKFLLRYSRAVSASTMIASPQGRHTHLRNS